MVTFVFVCVFVFDWQYQQ